MPRPVKAYACVFRCGQRTTTVRRDMEAHEGICIRNPATRACPTCRHEHKAETGYSCPVWMWACEIDELPEGKNLVIGCEQWEQR